jgi:hypothetical protein
MNIRHLTLTIGMVLLLASAGSSADIKTKDVRCTSAATFVSGVENHLDTNDDGQSAGVHQGLASCNIGRFISHEVFEFQAPLSAPVSCPAGTQEFGFVQAHRVLSTEKTADQLFVEDGAGGGTLCLYPDLTFTFTEHGTFAGGTGQFTGASGSFDGQGTGKYLVFGSKDGVFGGVGQYTETVTETLNIRK